MTTDDQNTPFSSLFTPADVICRTEVKNRDKVLHDLLERMALRRPFGDVEDAYRAVLVRETDMATIVAPGMAMPHVRLDTITHLVVGVATSAEGIVFDPSRPDSPVKLLILTLAPKASPGAYLQALGSVAAICRAPSTPDVVANFDTPEDVWAFFDKGGTSGL